MENPKEIDVRYLRLQEVAKMLGITVADIGNKIGGKRLHGYKDGKFGELQLTRMQTTLGINSKYIMEGIGEPLISKDKEVQPNVFANSPSGGLPEEVHNALLKYRKNSLIEGLQPSNLLANRPDLIFYSPDELQDISYVELDEIRMDTIHLLNRYYETVYDLKARNERNSTNKEDSDSEIN